ncbi:MAG: hypothetical protein PHF86_11695 [Candidatus Nanoarchaeia archaeon]|nr:hypothetical protein [Candidatus Nanoarchaeia archaeon]
MIRQDLFDCSASWHQCSVYDAGMRSILKNAINIGTVDNLIKFILEDKFKKKNTSRVFIEFFHDYKELKEKESMFNDEYIKVPHEYANVRKEGIFRVIGKDSEIKALIIVSRFARQGNILLFENEAQVVKLGDTAGLRPAETESHVGSTPALGI